MTEQRIKESIKLSDLRLGVTSLKPIKGGGVYVGTDSADGGAKLHDVITNKLGESFETKKPRIIAPKRIISGISREYDNEDLLEELLATNHRLTDEDRIGIKVMFTISKRKDAEGKQFGLIF